MSLRLAKRDLPKLERLECMPKVALLYATYNDVMLEILDALHNQSYSNCDIFVLDDSTDKRCRLIVDACGFLVIRRSSRSGFKAGALNNWLSLYGRVYDYYDRIANECETVLSWGHNNLHRVSHLMEVGGFDTRYVCEDYATAINLINRGYKCRLLDL